MKNLITDINSQSPLKELYKEGKVYVMDNHLAASWCWSQTINFDTSYNLFHIDKHYDLLSGSIDFWISELNRQNFDLRQASIADTSSIMHGELNGLNNYEIFRHDTYMTIFKRLYPAVLNDIKFATHKDGTVPNDWNFYKAEIYDLPTNLEYWITETSHRWIINIDIDFFFDLNSSGQYFQFLSDEYIKLFSQQLLEAWDNIEVITIALSPNFCGGPKNAWRVLDIMCDTLNIRFRQ